jgi:hypothetical protein
MENKKSVATTEPLKHNGTVRTTCSNVLKLCSVHTINADYLPNKINRLSFTKKTVCFP